MIERVQLFAVVVSIALLLLVLELVRRRKLVEEYALLWIGCALAALALSMWRGILHRAARELGVYYPPSVILIALAVVVFIGLLWLTVVLSRQRRQIERLIEETAVLDAELRALRTGTIASSQMIARAPEDRPESLNR